MRQMPRRWDSRMARMISRVSRASRGGEVSGPPRSIRRTSSLRPADIPSHWKGDAREAADLALAQQFARPVPERPPAARVLDDHRYAGALRERNHAVCVGEGGGDRLLAVDATDAGRDRLLDDSRVRVVRRHDAD